MYVEAADINVNQVNGTIKLKVPILQMTKEIIVIKKQSWKSSDVDLMHIY